MINDHNYEAWLLDYAEGNLSATERKQVEAYLDDHPAARAELEAFDPVYLSPDKSISYAHKETLKKEAGGGRVVFFNFGGRAAAVAAAILAAVVALFTIFFQQDDRAAMVAGSEVPVWQIPALEGLQIDPAGEDDQQTRPARHQQQRTSGTSRSTLAEAGEEEQTKQREAPASVRKLQQEGIASISTQKEFYYYNHSSVTASLSRSASRLNHTFEKDEVPHENNGLINNILNTEVARAFVPEALEGQLPERSEERSSSAPTIYLELPPAGKKLVDKILK